MRRVLDRFEIRGVPTLLVEVGDELGSLELVSVPDSWESAAVAAHLDSLSPEALAYLFPRPGREKSKLPDKGSSRALHVATEEAENRATLLDSAICRLAPRDEAHTSPIPRSETAPANVPAKPITPGAPHALPRVRSSVVPDLGPHGLRESSDVFAACNDTTAPLDE